MTINYDKKRLVAFLDVMGFTKLLKPNPENLKKLNRYYEVIKEIRVTDVNSMYTPGLKVDIMAVSDSIVISIQIDNEWSQDVLFKNTGIFFSQLAMIQSTLALEGIWIRGAVTVGDLFIDTEQSILVGQAFVDAFNLEKQANFPRIIIDSRILKLFGMSAPIFCKTLKSQSVAISDFNSVSTFDSSADDFMQIDWFGQILYLAREPESQLDIQEELDGLKLFFDDLTERQYDSGDIFLKSQKLIGYLRDSFWSSFLGHNRKKNQIYDYAHSRISILTGLKDSY